MFVIQCDAIVRSKSKKGKHNRSCQQLKNGQMEYWILDTIQNINIQELYGIQGENTFVHTNDCSKLIYSFFPPW